MPPLSLFSTGRPLFSTASDVALDLASSTCFSGVFTPNHLVNVTLSSTGPAADPSCAASADAASDFVFPADLVQRVMVISPVGDMHIIGADTVVGVAGVVGAAGTRTFIPDEDLFVAAVCCVATSEAAAVPILMPGLSSYAALLSGSPRCIENAGALPAAEFCPTTLVKLSLETTHMTQIMENNLCFDVIQEGPPKP